MMRILFLNSSREWGGNEKWTHLASHALARAGHSVWLAYRKTEVGGRFEIPTVRWPFVKGFDPVTLTALIRFIRRHRIEVLVPTKRKDYVLAGLASRALGVANVLRLGAVRDLENRAYHDWVFNRMADGVIVNARPIKEVLLRSDFMRPERIRVILNGLDVARLDAVEPGVGESGRFLVTSVGRISPRKRMDVVVGAFARFVEEEGATDAVLVILGDGRDLDKLRGLAESSGARDQIHLPGFVDDPYPTLAGSQVYVMASSNEGISNALLEAVYLGNAAIATPAGGAGDILRDGENGFLVGTDDPAAIADRLGVLYRDPDLRARLAMGGRAMVVQTFSLERMRTEMEVFLKEAIDRRA